MKKTNLLISVLFCIFFVGMMCLFFIMPKQEFSQNEKRVLEEMPKLSIESLADGSWFSKIDTYLSDHFFARDFWVGLHSYTNQAVGLNGDIYKGKDNWLLEKPITQSSIWTENIQIIEQFVKKYENIYFIPVPTKGYIMQDKLPKLHDNYPDEQLINQLKSLLSEEVSIIDVSDVLSENSDVYYKTDHHWTSKGAYMAYSKAGEQMGFTPNAQKEYDIENYDGFYGTSYSKSGLWATPADTISLWKQQNLDVTVSITDENRPFPIEYNSMFFTDHLNEADKYPVFLDGNHAFVNLKSNAENNKKLLIIRDSFAHCLAPFLASEYSEIDLIDLRYFKKQTASELIEQNNYDDILFVYGLDTLATDRSLQWLK